MNSRNLAPISQHQSERHLKEEDSDEDEERDEEDGPLAELQEGLAAEEPHYPRLVCQLKIV